LKSEGVRILEYFSGIPASEELSKISYNNVFLYG